MPVLGLRPLSDQSLAVEHQVPELIREGIGHPHGREEVGGQQPREDLRVDLVRLHLRLGDHPRLERVGDDDSTGMLAQEAVEGQSVRAGLEDDLVLGAELAGERADRVGPGWKACALGLVGPRAQDGHLGGVPADVESDGALHPLPLFLRRSLGGHDNYPSELEAQPGGSKGRPVRITDSRSINPPACPHRVIAGTAVRPTPAAQSLQEIDHIAMHGTLHTS